MRFLEKTKGAVSIFLVIILVPMMTVSAVFVDASKVKLARGVAESAGDLTLNTALTDYDTKLKDLYGLFATSQDMNELFEKLEDYYRTCITSTGVSKEDADDYVDMIMAQLDLVASNDNTADMLNMELIDFNVSKRKDATLADATILKRQIVDFMKYRAPINTGLSFLSSLQGFSTLSKQTELVDKRQEYYKEQENVMRNAQEAWKYIYKYNQSGFIKSDDYFPNMESDFESYEGKYQNIAKKVIMDLYDAQNYGDFVPYQYFISYEEVEINDSKETIPIFYTNKKKTSKKKTYNKLLTYSDSKKATEADIKRTLNEYYTAYKIVKTAQEQLMEYNNETYGQQYLIQTNRRGLYTTWVQSMETLYEKYNMLRHAEAYADTNDSNQGVMNTSEKMFDESSAHPYSYYYDRFINGFEDVVNIFNQKLTDYNSTLKRYKDNTNTSTSEVENNIALIYEKSTKYRKTISDAKTNLEAAVTYLGYVLDGVKSGGTLEQKETDWKRSANANELKNTSMAKQDLAEIDSLSTYLNPKDVQKLMTRLNNIIGHLGEMLDEIDGYTFFGTKVVEISDYTTFTYILKSQIGDDALKRVPTNKSELETQINTWCNGKFVIVKKVDSSWRNQSGTKVNLSGTGTDKLNFYSYLYEHFNTASEASNNTDEMVEDKTNGKELYKDIKKKGSSVASNKASETDSNNISTDKTNELNSLIERPSLNMGNDAAIKAAEVKTGDSVAKDTSKSLGEMFSSLSSAIMNMGTDLRDKLYISDYILSMFSYDTIEKEFSVKNSNKKLDVKTITLNPINADNNYAYGKEVEYIIYGQSNELNLKKAYGSIYGIRFGFNVIYAFTDSSIRDTAFAIATPISAATLGVIPVPLIQAAIIIGIACCESAADLLDIKNGKSVPLFKSQETWRCSVKGLINEVKAGVGEMISEEVKAKVDEGTNALSNILSMTDEELNNFIEGGTDKLTGDIESAYDTLIARHANTAIQKLTTLANNALEESALDSEIDKENYISRGLDNWLALEAQGVDTSSDISYIVKKEAVDVIKSQFINEMINVLENSKENASDEINNMGAAITNQIDVIQDEIIKQVNKGCDKVKEYKSSMVSKLQESMKNGAQSVKETLNEQIDGIFGSSSVEGSDNTGISSLISFAYSDYLRLFLMIGLYTNEEGVLLRTADAIQANMIKKKDDTGYRLSNSAVYVNISTTIQIKPTLLALPLFADVEGNPSTNTKWYTIQYESIKGY